MMIGDRRCVMLGLLLAGLLSLGLAGCGRRAVPTYAAGGKVVFPDGKALGGGWVWLEAIQGGGQVPGSRGQIQSDGSFHLGTYRTNDGAAEGEFRALITPPPPEGGLKQMKVMPIAIDPRFSQFDTSDLKCTVTRDPAKNQFVLQVDHPRAKRE
jgi:hypothetical protein